MLIDDYLPLESINEEVLDKYLSDGYYRMHQSIFTTDAIFLNEMWLPVFWLRVDVHRLALSATAQKIAKMNSRFSVSVAPAVIDDEINALYGLYKSTITFNGYESVSTCLNGDNAPPIFNTLMMQVRDGEKLIAVGYFDCGKSQAAACTPPAMLVPVFRMGPLAGAPSLPVLGLMAVVAVGLGRVKLPMASPKAAACAPVLSCCQLKARITPCEKRYTPTATPPDGAKDSMALWTPASLKAVR
jgi:hypothetical protein